MLHIAHRLRCHCVFSLCRSPILNKHSWVLANCDHMLELVHWVNSWIGIALWWVMLRQSLLMFLLLVPKMQFSVDQLYTSFQVTRSVWRLTIHRSFCPSPVSQQAAISGKRCTPSKLFPTLATCKTIAASAFFTCTNFKTGSKLPELSGIVLCTRPIQYPMKAPSSFGS